MFILPRIFEEFFLICVVSARNGVVNSVQTDNWIADLFVHYRPQEKVKFSQVSVSHYVHIRPHGYSVTAPPCYHAVGMQPTGMLSCF